MANYTLEILKFMLNFQIPVVKWPYHRELPYGVHLWNYLISKALKNFKFYLFVICDLMSQTLK